MIALILFRFSQIYYLNLLRNNLNMPYHIMGISRIYCTALHRTIESFEHDIKCLWHFSPSICNTATSELVWLKCTIISNYCVILQSPCWDRIPYSSFWKTHQGAHPPSEMWMWRVPIENGGLIKLNFIVFREMSRNCYTNLMLQNYNAYFSLVGC